MGHPSQGNDKVRAGWCVIVWRAMRFFFLLAVVGLAGGVAAWGQGGASGELPKDPRAVLAMAAPFYNFDDASMKPWHLKATYQLYDEKGNASSQGTYEYWWVSPTVHRSTWMRDGNTHSDWYTSDGKHFYLSVGASPEFFEYKIQSDILSPLPEPSAYDPAKSTLDRDMVKAGRGKVPCIMIVPKMPVHGAAAPVPLGMFPTYCFDARAPVLLMKTSFGSLTVNYSHFATLNDRYIPQSISELEGGRKILTMAVDAIDGLKADDPALTPPEEVKSTSVAPVELKGSVMAGRRIKGEAPVYPQDAKEARAEGTVELKALIGRDGKIHDLQVVRAAYPSLVASALWAVSRWEYQPYLLNGEPVDVLTDIQVNYSLGG